MKDSLKRYYPLLREYKLQYLLIIIGIIFTVSATTATAHIMKPLMDEMFIEKKQEMLLYLPLGLISIYLFKSAGRYLQSVFTSYIGLHMVTTLREILLEKMLSLDMSFLYKNRSGDLISRITYDIDRIRYFVSNMLPELMRESLIVVALIGYVIYLNPLLAFYCLVVLPLAIYPVLYIGKKLKRYARRSQEKNADVISRLSEVFNNAEMIKANETSEFELERFTKKNREFLHINMKSIYVGDIVSPFMELVGASGLALVIFLGGKEVYEGRMSVGEFSAFITAIGLVFQPIRRIGSIFPKIQDAIAASERIFALLDQHSAIKDGKTKLDGEIKSIEFRDVGLVYDGEQILESIDLSISANQKIALVGDSGGGKSTLINMLLRFFDTTSGEVLINGINIKDLDSKSLKDEIALVSQRVYIFADTLSANVAYASDIDEPRIHKALKLADASEFVAKLPSGIDSQLEEFGSNLSGGQRQRIAIARAIYKNASLILFDEATSALDNESEKRIQDAIDSFAKDKITITIAHRLSTIVDADLIVVMQHGKIVGRGTHNSLLQSSEIYKKLAREFVS